MKVVEIAGVYYIIIPSESLGRKYDIHDCGPFNTSREAFAYIKLYDAVYGDSTDEIEKYIL